MCLMISQWIFLVNRNLYFLIIIFIYCLSLVKGPIQFFSSPNLHPISSARPGMPYTFSRTADDARCGSPAGSHCPPEGRDHAGSRYTVPRCYLLDLGNTVTGGAHPPSFEKTSAAYRRFRIPLHRIRSFLFTRYGPTR